MIIQLKKKRKGRKSRTKVLKGNIHTGTLFIGDIGYFAANPQEYEGGIVPVDSTNPFKDGEASLATLTSDQNVELPGSFNGDLPGRGVVVVTNMLNGGYKVKKQVCKKTGKLKAIRVVFHE